MLKKMCLSLWIGLFLVVSPVFAAEMININRATQTQLETLKGIGPSTAMAIIEYREQTGAYKSVDDLVNVKGIGDKKLIQIMEQVVVSDPTPKLK